jgi:hypothetical protein
MIWPISSYLRSSSPSVAELRLNHAGKYDDLPMPDGQTNVLSYARHMKMRGRFWHLWAVLPFGVGLLIGGLLLGCLPTILPDFAADSFDSGLAVVAIYVAPVVGSLYAFILLLFIGLIYPHARVTQPFWVSATIGIIFQLFGVGLYTFFENLCTVASPPPWLETAGFFTGMVIVFFTGIAVPFGLLRWRESEVTPIPRAHPRSAWLKRLLVLCLCVMMFFVARWSAVRAFERDCQTVAAWVKTTHPTAGSYLAIPLPNSQRLLSGDGKIDAVVLPDGRVVLVARMAVVSDGHWLEIIYASGPIAPAEIGKDPSGRAHILINGLSENVVTKQVDAQHFNAVSSRIVEGW